MHYDWKEKVVIITGSSAGIGKQLATELACKGAIPVLNGRNSQKLQRTIDDLESSGFRVSGIPGDVSVYADCEQIVDFAWQSFGRIDVLVNNAGIASIASLEEGDPEVFRKVININFLGSVFMTRAALPFLKKSGGVVLFVGSLAGIHGIGRYAAYSSSKMALSALADSLRIELAGTGIHVAHALVGFTQNEPEKTFLDKDGKYVSLPERDNVRQESRQKVAKKLMWMIAARKKRLVFSPIGKLNYVMNFFVPALVHRILLRAYRNGTNMRIEKASKGIQVKGNQ